MAQLPKTMKAARVHKKGDVDEIVVEDVPLPEPKPDEILVKIEWGSVNFYDTELRAGLYPRPYPITLGEEGAGSIVSLPTSADVTGSEDYRVRGFKRGAKAAIFCEGGQTFAEYVAIVWYKVEVLPDGLDTREAAAWLAHGLTALTFAKEAYEVKKGDYILVHAAAGGVGLRLTQIASQLGAIVIGTTSSQAKADIAKKAGATYVINYTDTSIPDAVLEFTLGRGVEAIFDSIGAATWEGNFKSIRRKGTIVSVGHASGLVPPFSIGDLLPKNIKLVFPAVYNYIAEPAEFHQYACELLQLVKDGKLDVMAIKEYPFTTDGVRQTHIDMTTRGTFGKMLIKIADQT